MSIFGHVCLAFVLVTWTQVPGSSLPTSTKNRVGRTRDEMHELQRLFAQLRSKTWQAKKSYAKANGLNGDSTVDLFDYFVNRTSSPIQRWTSLKQSERLSNCVRTLKAFMRPLKVIMQNEMQTGNLRSYKAIRKLRNIWLLSTYSALETMANTSNIVLDKTIKRVNVKKLRNVVKSIIKKNFPNLKLNPTILRNHAILEALHHLTNNMNVCQINPNVAITTRSSIFKPINSTI